MNKMNGRVGLFEKLREAEEKQDNLILERIRLDVVKSPKANPAGRPAVSTRVSVGHRVATH